MWCRTPKTMSDEFSVSWSRWTRIIEFSVRRSARRLDPVTYETLHRGLLTACRSLVDSAGEEDRDYYEGLETLVGPWLNTTVLAQASHPILAGVLKRCLNVESDLRAKGRSSKQRRILALTSSVLGLAILLAILPLMSRVLPPALDLLLGVSDTIWLTVTRSSDLQKLGAGVVLVILISLGMVTQTTQS